MSTLTELIYGNINVFERPVNQNCRYPKLAAALWVLERSLEDGLPEEKEELFKEYLAVTGKRQIIADEKLFTNGFSLGARLICDVFSADEA